jgi:hypothetical protein
MNSKHELDFTVALCVLCMLDVGMPCKSDDAQELKLKSIK